jgi:hypothetical protein
MKEGLAKTSSRFLDTFFNEESTPYGLNKNHQSPNSKIEVHHVSEKDETIHRLLDEIETFRSIAKVLESENNAFKQENKILKDDLHRKDDLPNTIDLQNELIAAKDETIVRLQNEKDEVEQERDSIQKERDETLKENATLKIQAKKSEENTAVLLTRLQEMRSEKQDMENRMLRGQVALPLREAFKRDLIKAVKGKKRMKSFKKKNLHDIVEELKENEDILDWNKCQYKTIDDIIAISQGFHRVSLHRLKYAHPTEDMADDPDHLELVLKDAIKHICRDCVSEEVPQFMLQYQKDVEEHVSKENVKQDTKRKAMETTVACTTPPRLKRKECLSTPHDLAPAAKKPKAADGIVIYSSRLDTALSTPRWFPSTVGQKKSKRRF